MFHRRLIQFVWIFALTICTCIFENGLIFKEKKNQFKSPYWCIRCIEISCSKENVYTFKYTTWTLHNKLRWTNLSKHAICYIDNYVNSFILTLIIFDITIHCQFMRLKIILKVIYHSGIELDKICRFCSVFRQPAQPLDSIRFLKYITLKQTKNRKRQFLRKCLMLINIKLILFQGGWSPDTQVVGSIFFIKLCVSGSFFWIHHITPEFFWMKIIKTYVCGSEHCSVPDYGPQQYYI